MTAHTKAGDWAKLDRADYRFHYMIVEASRHTRLTRAYNHCHIQLTGVRSDYAHIKELSNDATAAQHRSIVEYIECGDAKRAAQAASLHVRHALECIERHLERHWEDLATRR